MAEEPEKKGIDALFEATMMNLHGEPMPLSQFRGKPLVISFWSRMCFSCRDKFPELMALQAEYKKQGLIVLGIAINIDVALDEDPVKVREFLAAYGVDYPVALAGKQGTSLMQALGNERAYLPFVLLIDREGMVVSSKYGIFEVSDFQSVVRRLLQ